MNQTDAGPPSQQPPAEVTWQVTIRRLHKWISEPGEKASRPFVVMITDPERKAVIKTRIISEPPAPADVQGWILQAVNPSGKPLPPADYPQCVVFDDLELAQALQQPLAELHIRTASQSLPDEADEAIALFEGLIEESAPDFPGLLSITGLTPDSCRRFFADAEAFFLAQPWKVLSDRQPVALYLDPPGRQVYVQLMGKAGIQTGLNLFWDWQSLLRILEETVDPIDQVPADGLYSLSFEASTMLPGSDLDAIEKYGLPVAEAGAYPLPLIYARDHVQRPSLEELACMHAALLALPGFLGSLREDGEGEYLPEEYTLPVESILGRCQLRLSYPAGNMPEPGAQAPNNLNADSMNALEEEQVIFDELRLLEAATADQALAEFDQEASLRDAQMLVYKAWQSADSLERQLLAHQALELSGDCADAYVLLAEEEAQTIEEAHRFYLQALEAASRQLGDSPTLELSGSLWERFSTRPYLRALEGVANTLVELEKADESLAYFQKMLELDPDDHLGARYGYLHTLLELHDYQAAHQLLHAFPNELSAIWSYTHALISYIQKGAVLKAENSLRWALQQNPHVPSYLLGDKLLPENLPGTYSPGDEQEAIFYASEYFGLWWQAKGAIDWLKRLKS